MSGLFPNAWHVARREFLIRVRSRTFVITTVLLAVLAAGVVVLPVILSAVGVADPPEVAVNVEADDVATDPLPVLQSLLSGQAGAPDGGSGDEEPATVTRAEDPEAAAADVRDGRLDGLLTISRGTDGDLAFDYLSDAGPTNSTRLLVEQAAQAIAWSDRLTRAGVEPGQQGEIFAPPAFTASAANPEDARNEADFGPSLLVAYAVVILTFMAVLTYGNWVAQSVAEEKSSRVMELLITSASPRQLLTGKVLGTGAAGLTQYVAIIAAAATAFVLSGPFGSTLGVSAGELPELPNIDAAMIASLTAFFLGGFLLYCILYAATGSMVSRLEDVQQTAGPLMVIAMVGYFASFVALNVPDADWVGVLSIIPFFSPYFMPIRLLLASPAAWEVILAIVLLALTLVAATWVAARIYSAGVLLYGQRPGFRQVMRAARVAR